MTSQNELPLRQKILVTLTVVTGLFIIVAYYTSIMSWSALQLMILCYGVAVPVALFIQNTLVDLDNNDIFRIWLTIGVIFLVVYILSEGNTTVTGPFTQDHIEQETYKAFVKRSTTVLKALPTFLLCYWLLNRLLKKRTGKFIVNTFFQFKWYNNAAQRPIDANDVLINLILFMVITVASITKF